MNKYALIVAGGSGVRMKSQVPKQFLEIDGKPILVHTIEKFLRIDSVQVVLVLPENNVNFWKEIQKKYFFRVNIKVVIGGISRTDSVRNGLNTIHEDGLVSIHDAVRPFVSEEIIKKSFKSAEEFGSGVAAIQPKDSIREILSSDRSIARDRKDYVFVQTPQTFKVSEIKNAYAKTAGFFSDDASIYEEAGYETKLVEGDYSNIKITTQEDLGKQSLTF